jgi:hypothetical protein
VCGGQKEMTSRTWIERLQVVCDKYAISLEHLDYILEDPKVIPMIRGKAFEFAARDRIAGLLSEANYKVSNPFINPQAGSDKLDVLIQQMSDNNTFRLECKLAKKGDFAFKEMTYKALPKQPFYRIKVKCMRSRTLGEKAAEITARRTGRSKEEHLIHSDQYLPKDFDFVVTTIANAFFQTDDEGYFVWQPGVAAEHFLALIGVNSPNTAFEKMYIARSRDLQVSTENGVKCTRKICPNKQACGFIPNYPEMYFDADGKVLAPWYPLESIEILLT